MAITDIFKKEDKKSEKISKPAPKAKSDKKDGDLKTAAVKPPAKNAALAARILRRAHVTEKSARGAEKQDRYVFLVAKGAGKVEIARAVEGYYGVNVVSVNTVNVPAKRKRRAKGIAIEPGYRKAVVKIKKGQTIEIMPQ